MENDGTKRDLENRVLYELIDKDGKSVAVFTPPCLQQMAEYAKRLWPDQEQDEDRTGKGWSVREVQNV